MINEAIERKRVEVCFSPNLYPLHKDNFDIVVAIDVLRATSAICAGIHAGVKKIIPVSTLDEAIEYRTKGYIVAAERKGQIVDGFSMGNSPFSYMDEKLQGETIVLTTTNGTRAINIASKDAEVVVGALSNLDILSEWLREQNKNVLLLCSGWQNKFNLEDTICAGAIADHLLQTGLFTSDEDSSIAAKYLYQSAKGNIFGYLKSSSHRRRLKKLNLNEDIKYCLNPNQAPVIPVLNDGGIVKLQ